MEKDNVEIFNETLKFTNQYESFILEGDFIFNNNNEFGFVFGIGKAEGEYGHIVITPEEKIEYYLLNHTKQDSLLNLKLEMKKNYHFNLVCEGSIFVLYIDDVCAFTTRYYGKFDTGFGFYSKENNIKFYNLELRIRSI